MDLSARSRPVGNDETSAVAGLFAAAAHGNPALVIDTTSYDSRAADPCAAALRDLPVACVTGLVMRRGVLGRLRHRRRADAGHP